MLFVATRAFALSLWLLSCFSEAHENKLFLAPAQRSTQPYQKKSKKEYMTDLFTLLLGEKTDGGSCSPDVLRCLSDKNYSLQCPVACENILSINEMLQTGQQHNLYDWLRSKLGGVSSARPLDSTGLSCAPCPHINCCVTFDGTVAEALLVQSGVYNTSPMVVSTRIFEELAWQQEEHVLGFDSSPVEFYSSTVQYFFNVKAVDLGWINEFLGTIMTYGRTVNTGVHSYRKVPLLDDGTLDYDFSTVNVHMPESKPLVIAVVGDVGCGNDVAVRVLEEIEKQKPDIVLHLGDVYYSGAQTEQEAWIKLLRETLGEDMPVFMIPGNHDYYSDGAGFMWSIDEVANSQTLKQDASFVALRGNGWQIIMLDTAILDSFQLNIVGAINLGEQWEKFNRDTLPFLPNDQLQWALKQIELGKSKGVKTILMSHHQLFSRREGLGFPNGGAREIAFGFDEQAGVYETTQWAKTSIHLPGNLDEDVQPSANTRLLDQFPPEVLADVSAWFWGHEHSMTAFKPYAGLSKGRLLGHGCIGNPILPDHDNYAPNPEANGSFWGGHPEPIEGSQQGSGANFWNRGFATITINASHAHAKYFEMSDYREGRVSKFTNAVVHFEEDLW